MPLLPVYSGQGCYHNNASFRLGKKEIAAFCEAVKYAMYMVVPEIDEKVLFHVFSPALLEMSPSCHEASGVVDQLNFVEALSDLLGARNTLWHYGKKTRIQEFQGLLTDCYALPVLVELEKTDEFTYYHLFGLDASAIKFIRALAKTNFGLYRISRTVERGMFGLRGRILKVDTSDRTFKTLLGDVISKEQLMAGPKDA